MYDMKHKRVWIRVKLFGVARPIEIQSQGGLILGMQEAMRVVATANARYGPSQIEWQFEPFDKQLTSQQIEFEKLLAGIDPSLIEQETDEEAASPKHWDHNPMNVNSPSYDPLYHEYQNCTSPAHRQTKTPEDLSILRKHLDTHYYDSIWWDRSHRW